MSSIQKSMKNIPVEGLICLEAGTGAGNMTCYLVKRGAKLVYSISDNQEHLDYARSKLSNDEAKKVKFINSDLCDLSFLSPGAIDLITAHMLINVVPPVDLFSIFNELTRVAKKDALMVINDYNPFFSYQTKKSYLVEELFRIENAIHYIVEGKLALIWYPSEYIINLLQLLGWVQECMNLIYSKTPWEKELLKEHIDVIKDMCVKVNHEDLREDFLQNALEIFNKIGDEEVIYAGSIYSIKMRKKCYNVA
ncbi:MAG: methyltransferase domain-containing protein [Candidatus Thermoplasmatota archaeon]